MDETTNQGYNRMTRIVAITILKTERWKNKYSKFLFVLHMQIKVTISYIDIYYLLNTVY